jgi:hypothetical protein
MERVRYDVLAATISSTVLWTLLKTATLLNRRVARRHGAEQGFQLEVLNQSVHMGRQRLLEIKNPISEHEESLHDARRSFKLSSVTRYFSAMDSAWERPSAGRRITP